MERRKVKTITRLEIAAKIAEDMGLSKHHSASILDTMIYTLRNSIVEHNGSKIASFGTFVVHNKAERIGRNPKTKEEASIAARKSLSWRPSKILKDRMLYC